MRVGGRKEVGLEERNERRKFGSSEVSKEGRKESLKKGKKEVSKFRSLKGRN